MLPAQPTPSRHESGEPADGRLGDLSTRTLDGHRDRCLSSSAGLAWQAGGVERIAPIFAARDLEVALAHYQRLGFSIRA
jgi:hypothetical protein